MFAFRNLREMFRIDAADYMMSICGNDALRELSSPGKSGSVFFLSQDDRFMIKTLRKSEVKVQSPHPNLPYCFGLNSFDMYLLLGTICLNMMHASVYHV